MIVISQQGEIHFFLNAIDAQFAAPNVSSMNVKQKRFYFKGEQKSIRTEENGVKERNKQRNSSKVCFGWGYLRESKPKFMFNIKFMHFYYDDRSFSGSYCAHR